jgi:hypothetical protein
VCVNKAKCKGTSLPGSTPAGRPAEQARLAARSRSATARWIPGGDRVSTYHKSRGGQGEHGHRGGRVGCGSASHAFYSRETDQLKNADANGKIGVSADGCGRCRPCAPLAVLAAATRGRPTRGGVRGVCIRLPTSESSCGRPAVGGRPLCPRARLPLTSIPAYTYCPVVATRRS